MAQPNLLPEFELPPVYEVAISIEFSPLKNLNASNIFSYGKLIQADFPDMELHPALPSVIEKVDEEILQPMPFRIEMVNEEANRFWFLAKPANWLIQIQNDRFVINWRKVTGDETYPRYLNAIRPQLEKEWQRFRNFVEQQNLGNIEITQCDVTYVNDINKGTAWNTTAEAMELITPLSAKSNNQFLPNPETINFSSSYLMHEGKGRLRFILHRAFRLADKQETLQLRLTARGKPSSSTNKELFEWIDTGREWIVRGFKDLTTNKAHTYWKRKQ